jgi:GNAT superfamily N-acetyltransferase
MTLNWFHRATIPGRALGSDGSLRTACQNTRKLVSRHKVVDEEVTMRPFAERDAAQVRALFITVNRLLSPLDLRDAFEAYIERALAEEIDRISAYYGERDGCFWVALKGDNVVGTFGLERASDDAMELRRMYVDPLARRQGIARQMLQFAENECRRQKVSRLELSTAEIQQDALALYRNAGYRLVHEETVEGLSNKIVGSGLLRYYFEKIL